ncbi:UvrD-helicase domain-containing protein [Desulfonatronum sp. SC1]|uniref:UvrD-helicase domain-containing protein n=1 Tax=Desulfonatronum sp. SC1 TaxID=2109626 RepID=UPI000D3031FC|nr:UvrD-helicase domain-containing protein [Desulfonatronum sp. SC1]PTN32733.1 DNA helicase UvrD [Desulfonatronum sp. SC1]
MTLDLFRADLHIHSRYSRATSRGLTPNHLVAWARVKGLDVVATGDFTHPGWLQELEESLEEDGSGLLIPRRESDLSAEIPWLESVAPVRGPSPVRFILSAEISTIYKRAGRVRKVHHLVYVPGLEQAKALNVKLGQIGNLGSDGRPILGLDSRHLLEMVLELHPRAFLVPAHIWTPWFSLFGSKSGFDTIEECYGELSSEIFALETGLSSDPDMNWQWSALDRFRMISNSDAHSGEKLAREANLFRGEPSFEGMYKALRGEGESHAFLGTVEFFPEEGKYHLDGHRKCDVVLSPDEAMARGNVCPVCGQPLTLGVLHRVRELADRDQPHKPPNQPGFQSLVPLVELISEVLGKGPATKTVRREYAAMVAACGSELDILGELPLDEVARRRPVLAESLHRMRQGRVLRRSGYDGHYGTISMFTPQEQRELRRGRAFFAMPSGDAQASASESEFSYGVEPPSRLPPEPSDKGARPEVRMEFNAEQDRALRAGPRPVLVLAGPGTGKTRTLMGRITQLLQKGEQPRRMLVATFTRRAANELRERLVATQGQEEALPQADTLHAVAYEVWTRVQGEAPVLLSEDAARRVFAAANPELGPAGVKQAWNDLSRAREGRVAPDLAEGAAERVELAARYARQKQDWNLVDYTDLLEFWLAQATEERAHHPYAHILVDEVQDLSRLQWELLQALAPRDGSGFWGIGDPRQSIYGFRGAMDDIAAAMRARWPDLEVVSLSRNYRSAENLVRLSGKVFPDAQGLLAENPRPGRIAMFQASSGAREAAWIAGRTRALLGGTAHWEADRGAQGGLSPGDVAVLVRIRALIPPMVQAMQRLGVPCSAPESEPFWKEPRVALLLQAASELLGLGRSEDSDQEALTRHVQGHVLEHALVQGPVSLAAHLQEVPPFDRLFWQSKDFLRLKEAYARHKGWPGLLTWINFHSELELVRARAETVQVMTLHASKGLEFEAVFLPTLEDGLLPMVGLGPLGGRDAEEPPQEGVSGPLSSSSSSFIGDLEEERRLFYVGLTRAKQWLFLSHAEKRNLFGRTLRLKPSRFLGDLPREEMLCSKTVQQVVRREKRMDLFS